MNYNINGTMLKGERKQRERKKGMSQSGKNYRILM